MRLNFSESVPIYLRLGLLTSLIGCASAPPPAPQQPSSDAVEEKRASAFVEYDDPGVLLVAIPRTDSKLIEMQMSIVQQTIHFGPVLVYVNGPVARREIVDRCKERSWCDQIRSGQLRVVDADFVGPWIRDYGPQFTYTEARRLAVVDAGYHDVRLDWSVESKKEEIDNRRMEIINDRMSSLDEISEHAAEHRWKSLIQRVQHEASAEPSRRPAKIQSWAERRRQQDSDKLALVKVHDDELEERANLDLAQEQRARATEELNLLKTKKEILDNPRVVGRVEDDRSPFAFAKAVLNSSPGFEMWYPKADVDGGNLMRLRDGRCVTTVDLVGRNSLGAAQGVRLEDTLRQYYACKETIFLRPLPGDNVIEHVDMFLLPAIGDKLLVADYRPTHTTLSRYFAGLDDRSKVIVLEAAVAMDENAKILHSRYGYDVVRVPSPLPILQWGSIVYPTVLNALVRVNKDKARQVILPRYAKYQEDVQDEARKIIEQAFPGATFDAVEAMHAAEEQGAVHCLTLVAPYDESIFVNDGWNEMSQAMHAFGATSGYMGVWQDEDHVRFYVSEGQILVMNGEKKVKTWEIDTPKSVGSKHVAALLRERGEIWLDMKDDDGTIEVRRDGAQVQLFRVKRWVPPQ